MDTDDDASGADEKMVVEAEATKKMAKMVADMKKQKHARVSIEAPPVEEMDISESNSINEDNGLETSSLSKQLAQAPMRQRQKNRPPSPQGIKSLRRGLYSS